MRRVLLSVLVLALGGAARADDAPKPRLQTKVFSVADLVNPFPEEALEQLLPGAVRLPKEASRAGSEAGARLVEVVTGVVRPYSWGSVGGFTARYVEKDATLIVTAEADPLQEIADLLEALRRVQDRQICSQVMVVSMPVGLREQLKLNVNGETFLSERECKRLTEALEGNRDANIMLCPRVTSFSGQDATITTGDQRTFVSSIEAVRVKGQTVLVPKQQSVQLGVSVTVRGRASADGKSVKLRVKFSHTSLVGEVELVPVTSQITPVFEGGSQGKPIPFTQFLEAPNFKTEKLDKTLTLPCGGTVVLGGWKESVPVKAASPAVLSKVPYINRLYKNVGPTVEREVFVVVTTHVIRAEQAELAPMARCVSSGEQSQPDRYSHEARQAVVAPFAPQVQNGRVFEQTVWNSFFEAGSARLTEQGIEKLHAIIRKRSESENRIYIQDARDVGITNDNVGTAAARREVLNASRAGVVQRHLAALSTTDGKACEVLVVDAKPAAPAPVVVTAAAQPAPAPAAPVESVRVLSAHALKNVAAADAAKAVTEFATQNKLTGVVVVAEPATNTVLVSGDAVAEKRVAKILADMDVAPKQVLIQALVLEAPREFLADMGLTRKDGEPLVLTERELAMFTAALRKAKADGKFDILSRPQIQVADNQTGRVQVGSQGKMASGLELTQTSAGLTVTKKMMAVEQGLAVAVTPRISPKGDSVLLRAETKVTHLTDSGVTIPLTLPPDVTGLKEPVTYQVPAIGAINEQSIQTTVQVPVGGSVILSAGVRKEKGSATGRETLILLTPHVVKSEAVQPAALTVPQPVTLPLGPQPLYSSPLGGYRRLW